MDDSFKKEFNARVYYPFLSLKSKYEVLREIPKHSHREVKSILALELWRMALSGFIIHLDTFGKQLAKYFQEIKAQHRDKIKRNYWKQISQDPNEGVVIGVTDPEEHQRITRGVAIHFTNQRREGYKKLWDKLFPSASSAEKGIPSTVDLDALIEKIRTVGQRISDHRDTVAAHPDDPNPKPATWNDVDKAMAFLQELIEELGLAFFDTVLGMEPGYEGGDPSHIAESLKGLIYFDEEDEEE